VEWSVADVVFGWSRKRSLLVNLAINAIGALIVTPVLAVNAALRHGGLAPPDVAFLIIFLIVYPFLGAGLWMIATRRRPPGIRITPDGLKLAASRADAVRLAWADVASVRLRRRWPARLLEVVPTTADAGIPVRRGRITRRPATTRSGGHRSFVVDVDSLAAAPDVILAEIRRHQAAARAAVQVASQG
jgi:hypothetical protein